MQSMDATMPDGVPLLRAELVAIGKRQMAHQRRLCLVAVRLEHSGEWAADGAPTCAHWIADALDVEVSTAREWLRIGRSLAGLEVVDEAFVSGRLSYSKVRALTRVATPATASELCRLAERTPAGRLGTALASWLVAREQPQETELRQGAARGLSWRTEPDGMTVGWFRLPPARAAVLTTAVDAQVLRRPAAGLVRASADASGSGGRWPSLAQQRADALVDIIGSGGTTVDTEVVVHLRGDGSTFDDGTPIAGSVVERMIPDAMVRVLLHDAQSRPVNASSRRRHPSARQRRVVRERDQACVDCGDTELLQFDHVPTYDETRHTVVNELEMRCWRCHQARHRRLRGLEDPDPGGPD